MRRLILFLALIPFAVAPLTAGAAGNPASTSAGATSSSGRNLRVDAVTPAAASDHKVALVIGNSDYRNAPLRNPAHDAADMASKLRSLGFDVLERPNIKAASIGRTLREFRALLTPGSVALFFYAGHGLQIKGENYLPAVDADIQGEEDVPNQSIAVRQILDVMEDARTRMNLAFLDACRNNPYARSFRSGGEGLARVSAPTGTLISFATRPGSVAADGTGRNGLYTSELLKAIDEPNLPVELMLKRVTTGVKQVSRGLQEPWMEGSIEGDFEFRMVDVPAPAVVNAATAEQQKQEAVAQALAQAARERADLQRQLDEARRKPAGTSTPVTPAAPAVPPAVALAAPAYPVPTGTGSGASAAPSGDWIYHSRDALFGKDHVIRMHARGTDARGSVAEDWFVDEVAVQSASFDGSLVALGAPIESRFIVGPNWNQRELPMITVSKGGNCVVRLTCQIRLKPVGKETITLPAGTFEALRLDGQLMADNPAALAPIEGKVTIWWSEPLHRMLRQTVRVNARPAPNVRAGDDFWADETVELESLPANAR